VRGGQDRVPVFPAAGGHGSYVQEPNCTQIFVDDGMKSACGHGRDDVRTRQMPRPLDGLKSRKTERLDRARLKARRVGREKRTDDIGKATPASSEGRGRFIETTIGIVMPRKHSAGDC